MTNEPRVLIAGPLPPTTLTELRQSVLASMVDDQTRVDLIQYHLETLEFKGTIHQIRELVNDPKWDDKI